MGCAQEFPVGLAMQKANILALGVVLFQSEAKKAVEAAALEEEFYYLLEITCYGIEPLCLPGNVTSNC